MYRYESVLAISGATLQTHSKCLHKRKAVALTAAREVHFVPTNRQQKISWHY
jgi:hypothetical protein